MKKLLLTFFFISMQAQGARYIVEAHHELAAAELKGLSKYQIEKLTTFKHKYFSRLYVINTDLPLAEVLKKSWVKNVEPTHELEKQSLLPAPSSRNYVGDELFTYQWGLFNQGQTFIKEKDDIHNLPLKGVAGQDVGFEKLLPLIPGERPIVAVLDSGVDLNHPELQQNLWINEKECGKNPEVDNDGNGLPGDCHGWNFTEPLTSPAAKNPGDSDGHGTHVAGIIAAARNGSGIVGVAPNALILPIKVLRDSHSDSQITSSEAFTRAILYAIENGAKVINLSLAWPRALETKYLRNAVFAALANKVLVVAAGGNNNSAEPLFPCAYEGVICTAASTLDGKFAGFSNFGGHIDTIAPGEGILSLHPTAFEPDFFAVPGFEVRSGTSQSAPLVSGLLLNALALEPELSSDEIFARLYSAKSSPDKHKYVLGGAVTWEAMSTPSSQAVIRPVLKRVRQILVRADSLSSELKIPVKNYGAPSAAFKVSLQSLSPGLEVVSGAQSISQLATGERADLNFSLRVKDFTSESNIKLRITIESEGETQNFINEIPISRDLREDENFKKVEIKFAASPLGVGGARNGMLTSNLIPVETIGASRKQEFYLRRRLGDGEERKLEYVLFTREGNQLVQAPKALIIEKAVVPVAFMRTDLNGDGKEDYLIYTIGREKEQNFQIFSFYNDELEDLWPSFQHVRFRPQIVLQNMLQMYQHPESAGQIMKINFLSYQHAKLGKMKLPAFITEGQLPRIDQSVSSWERVDTSAKKRVYYLEPAEDNSFQLRALFNNVWEKKLKEELKVKFYEDVEIEELLPVSREDHNLDQIRVMVSVGFRTRRQLFIVAANLETLKKGPALPQLVLQTDYVDRLLSISQQGMEVVGDVYFNIYDRERSKLVTTMGLAQEGELIYRHSSENDVIAGHIASFKTPAGKFSIVQSREELLGIQHGTELKVTRRPKLRYSFLSQRMITEMYRPVIYERRGEQRPALFVDATGISGNRVYLLEEQEGELVSSIKNSLFVPNSCKAMEPHFNREAQAHEFIFLCLEEREFVLRVLEMK